MITLDKLKIEVIPNEYSDSGLVFIVYKNYFGIFFSELGRVTTTETLHKFLDAHKKYDGYSGLSIFNLLEKENKQ